METFARKVSNHISRLIFIVPLGAFGVMHFIEPEFFLKMVPAYLPGQYVWVYFSGVALTAASIAISTKKMARLASILLMVFVLVFILFVDLPMILSDGDTGYAQNYFVISLMKDTSLLGGTWMYFRIFNYEKIK